MAKVRNQWVATTWRVRVIEARRGLACLPWLLERGGVGRSNLLIVVRASEAVQRDDWCKAEPLIEERLFQSLDV